MEYWEFSRFVFHGPILTACLILLLRRRDRWSSALFIGTILFILNEWFGQDVVKLIDDFIAPVPSPVTSGTAAQNAAAFNCMGFAFDDRSFPRCGSVAMKAQYLIERALPFLNLLFLWMTALAILKRNDDTAPAGLVNEPLRKESEE